MRESGRLDRGPGPASLGQQRVLVVDQDRHIAELAATALRFAGFDTRQASSGTAALVIAAEFQPHLVLVDTALTDVDGFDVCRRIQRRDAQIRVVFLSDRAGGEDGLVALGAGGADCIAKPFSLDDLVARTRTVLRRSASEESFGAPTLVADEGPILRFADLELDQDRREVRRADNIIDLSPTEFAVLRLLLENGGRVVSRPQILAHVWTYDFHGDTSIVESYISYLRKKIDCFDPPLIQTLRGIGYSLRFGPAATPEGT